MQDFRSDVAAFVKKNIIGQERSLEAGEGDVPSPVHRAFHAAGLSSWWLSEKLGGRALSMEDSIDIVDELAYGDAGVAFSFFISILSTRVLELFGTDAQKDAFFARLRGAEGFPFAGMMGSELEAGSELLRTATTARRHGSSFSITGEKFICTNAAFAEFLIVIAAAPEDPTGYKALLVPKGTPGVNIVKRWDVLGVRGSSQYQVSLKNAVVPSEYALEPNGLRVLEIGLNFSRVLIAASAIGIARRIRDLGLAYGHQKKIKGMSLLQHPVFMAKIGQMEADIETMRAVCKTAARELDGLMASPDRAAQLLKVGTVKSAVVSKMVCGQIGWRLAGVGSELFGSLGYMRDHPIEKLVRDMRYVAIVEGGEDVTRELLYQRFVSLPL